MTSEYTKMEIMDWCHSNDKNSGGWGVGKGVSFQELPKPRQQE